MNDKPKGMKKCPTELKDYIFDIAGPLTKYLNGRMELSSNFNKRLIRRDAILMQWKGDYSELFSIAGDDDLDKQIADIVTNRSKGFHEWLVEHLESNNQLRKLYDWFQRLNWDVWWQDSIRSSDHNQLRNHFENAIYNYHVEMVQFIISNNKLRKRVLNDDKDDVYFVERFVCYKKVFLRDVFQKSAESKMLWTILQNVTLNDTNHAMDAAVMIGHLESVKWLHENRTEGCTKRVMDDAARYGHLEIVKWLYEHYPALCNLQDALARATQENRQDIIQVISEIIASRQFSNDEL